MVTILISAILIGREYQQCYTGAIKSTQQNLLALSKVLPAALRKKLSGRQAGRTITTHLSDSEAHPGRQIDQFVKARQGTKNLIADYATAVDDSRQGFKNEETTQAHRHRTPAINHAEKPGRRSVDKISQKPRDKNKRSVLQPKDQKRSSSHKSETGPLSVRKKAQSLPQSSVSAPLAFTLASSTEIQSIHWKNNIQQLQSPHRQELPDKQDPELSTSYGDRGTNHLEIESGITVSRFEKGRDRFDELYANQSRSLSVALPAVSEISTTMSDALSSQPFSRQGEKDVERNPANHTVYGYVRDLMKEREREREEEVTQHEVYRDSRWVADEESTRKRQDTGRMVGETGLREEDKELLDSIEDLLNGHIRTGQEKGRKGEGVGVSSRNLISKNAAAGVKYNSKSCATSEYVYDSYQHEQATKERGGMGFGDDTAVRGKNVSMHGKGVSLY